MHIKDKTRLKIRCLRCKVKLLECTGGSDRYMHLIVAQATKEKFELSEDDRSRILQIMNGNIQEDKEREMQLLELCERTHKSC